VPDIFHFWSTVSLLSAVVEDRVWYQKFRHEVLYPNLYVILVGPSGLGKGVAIGHAVRLMECATSINKYRGKVTAAHLIDYLGKPDIDEFGDRTYRNPKLWLVMDELRNDVSPNAKLVEEFVYLMTELYTASNYTIQTGTRTHGAVNIERPVINWFAGTTEDDLREVLTQRLLRTGFTARVCTVFGGDYDFNNRVPKIKYPGDYDFIFEHLCHRLWMLQYTTGAFMITDRADAELDRWYVMRPEPDEELLYSAWKRQHDLLIKFAMILSLADGGPLVIDIRHINGAKKMLTKVYEYSENLIEVSAENPETRQGNVILKYLKRRKYAEHTPMSRYFRNSHGMNSWAFKKAIAELEAHGLIMIGRKKTEYGPSGVVYYFVGDEDSEGNSSAQ
jgi:hypothetical protein